MSDPAIEMLITRLRQHSVIGQPEGVPLEWLIITAQAFVYIIDGSRGGAEYKKDDKCGNYDKKTDLKLSRSRVIGLFIQWISHK